MTTAIPTPSFPCKPETITPRLVAHVLSTLAAAIAAISLSAVAQAQNYPTRPIRFIVPSAGSGSGSDLYARLIGKKLSEAWGQPVVVDNRPGANGAIGAMAVVKAAGDGHTLMLGHPNQLTVGPAISANIGYDPTRDFSPVTQIMAAPSLWSVPASNPLFSTVAEFVALAKKRPGEISFGTTGIGSVGHLIGQLFSQRANIKLHHVPYKGAPPVVIDLAAGRINMMSAALAAQISFVREGKIKGIATTGLKRARLTPNVPTVAESGYPGFDVTAWHGILTAPKVDTAIINKLHREIVRIIALPDVREVLLQEGGDVVSNTPQEFATIIREEHAKWRQVVKTAAIAPE